jgi:hypothetical protein
MELMYTKQWFVSVFNFVNLFEYVDLNFVNLLLQILSFTLSFPTKF